MVLFAHLGRRRRPAEGAGRSRADGGRQAVPRGFEPVADALVAGRDTEAAATETGRDLAADGVSLEEAFAGLEATYAAVDADGPGYEMVRALCLAWAEVSLRYLHGLSCDDPLTGLASLPHLRSRLDEVYREAGRSGGDVAAERALVVVEIGRPAGATDDGFRGRRPAGQPGVPRFGSALRMAEIADGLRAVFSGGETLARAGVHRAVALVRRHPDLAAQVAALRCLLESRSAPGRDGGEQQHVWIEGLPSLPDSASVLLDELAR